MGDSRTDPDKPNAGSKQESDAAPVAAEYPYGSLEAAERDDYRKYSTGRRGSWLGRLVKSVFDAIGRSPF